MSARSVSMHRLAYSSSFRRRGALADAGSDKYVSVPPRFPRLCELPTKTARCICTGYYLGSWCRRAVGSLHYAQADRFAVQKRPGHLPWGCPCVATGDCTTAERAFAGCTHRARRGIKGNFGHRWSQLLISSAALSTLFRRCRHAVEAERGRFDGQAGPSFSAWPGPAWSALVPDHRPDQAKADWVEWPPTREVSHALQPAVR
jgi:hypothetical protein